LGEKTNLFPIIRANIANDSVNPSQSFEESLGRIQAILPNDSLDPHGGFGFRSWHPETGRNEFVIFTSRRDATKAPLRRHVGDEDRLARDCHFSGKFVIFQVFGVCLTHNTRDIHERS
jgi:hypothetical protein